MKNESACIYIDEFGTPELDTSKPGVSRYFIYAAVIIPKSSLAEAKELHSKILKNDFQNKYIKSAHIGNDKSGFAKYVNSFTALKSLKHNVVALVVDKEGINGVKGLSFKQVFIKYFQRLLSESFFDSYEEFHICADKTGYPEFSKSLEQYMRDTGGVEPTLFSNNTFRTAEDLTEEPLLQLADLYAGALGRYYCNPTEENRAKVIHDIIKSRISIEWYPKDSISLFAATNGFDSSFDYKLFEISIHTAQKYIDENPDDKTGIELLLYLIQESHLNPRRHISSKELKEYLCAHGIEIGDPIIKISSLRDKGVVIISPIGKKGYKFPTSQKELAEFYNRLSCNVLPQLKRGFILNDVLLRRSFGDYNVLADPEFNVLKSLCDIVNKQI